MHQLFKIRKGIESYLDADTIQQIKNLLPSTSLGNGGFFVI